MEIENKNISNKSFILPSEGLLKTKQCMFATGHVCFLNLNLPIGRSTDNEEKNIVRRYEPGVCQSVI